LGGGTVYLKRGTYTIGTTVTGAANVRLIGEGMGATIIKLKNSFAAGSGLETPNADNAYFADFTLDGNKANQTASCDVLAMYNGAYHLVERLEIKNGKRASGSWGGVDLSAQYSRIKSCWVHDNDYYGIGLYGYYSYVEDCEVALNGVYGIYATNGHQFIINNDVRDNSGQGIRVSTNTRVLNNFVFGNAKDGIVVASYLNLISNNTINPSDSNVGLDANDTYSAILLSAVSSDDNIISNNSIIDPDGSVNDFKYGIREDNSGCNSNIIVGNMVTLGNTGRISTQGAATEVGHNITTDF
jgi:hypothetical protein